MLIVAVSLFILPSCNKKKEQWDNLLNYKDFTNWDIYVKVPDKKVEIEEEMIDTITYLAPIAHVSNDPKNSVFRYVKADTSTMLLISGELIGFLTTKREYYNYHLKMKFRYGKRWKWLGSRPMDGGIFYPLEPHEQNRELNIHDGDIGSFWSFGSIADINCTRTTVLPKSITDIIPCLQPVIPSLNDSMFIYDTEGAMESFSSSISNKQICIANPISDAPTGEWNVIELISLGDTAIHIVNGKVVMVLLNCRYKKGDEYLPLTKGKISFQSEGGEMFVEYIKIRQIDYIDNELLNN